MEVACGVMGDYKFPEMYFYCEDQSIQRQIERIAKTELDAGKIVTLHGKPYFDFKLLMEAVEEYKISAQPQDDKLS